MDLGYSFLLVGYRGYGGNEGNPSEAGFNIDANAAMAFALSEGFNLNEIVLYGESLGTGVAINLAQKNSGAISNLRSTLYIDRKSSIRTLLVCAGELPVKR
jgi:hypothetical protein